MAKLPEYFEFTKPDGTIERVYVTHRHNSILFSPPESEGEFPKESKSDLERLFIDSVKLTDILREDIEIKNKHLERFRKSNADYIKAFESKLEESERLKRGIDNAIFCLANEDTSDDCVLEQIRMDLVKLLKGEKVTQHPFNKEE
jgi:hypothetical protein